MSARIFTLRQSRGVGCDVVIVIHDEQVIAIHEDATYFLDKRLTAAWLRMPNSGNDEWMLL